MLQGHEVCSPTSHGMSEHEHVAFVRSASRNPSADLNKAMLSLQFVSQKPCAELLFLLMLLYTYTTAGEVSELPDE